MSFFDKYRSLQKNLPMPLFIPFLKHQVIKIPLNSLLQTLCNLIVRRVTKEEIIFQNLFRLGL